MSDTLHDWVPSPYGHGEQACRRCGMTNREAAALGVLNVCRVSNEEEATADRIADLEAELAKRTTPDVAASRLLNRIIQLEEENDRLRAMVGEEAGKMTEAANQPTALAVATARREAMEEAASALDRRSIELEAFRSWVDAGTYAEAANTIRELARDK